jgi:hypothetical protein
MHVDAAGDEAALPAVRRDSNRDGKPRAHDNCDSNAGLSAIVVTILRAEHPGWHKHSQTVPIFPPCDCSFVIAFGCMKISARTRRSLLFIHTALTAIVLSAPQLAQATRIGIHEPAKPAFILGL